VERKLVEVERKHVEAERKHMETKRKLVEADKYRLGGRSRLEVRQACVLTEAVV
jgi:hypothetical protein